MEEIISICYNQYQGVWPANRPIACEEHSGLTYDIFIYSKHMSETF